MYVSERERNLAKQSAQSLEQYLASLGLVVRADHLEPANLARATQLLNKTNQMNLSTRRLSESQFSNWSNESGRHAFVFRVSDRFDDYGLAGIASLAVEGATARMIDYVLSCRVMGRGVEESMLSAVIEYARRLGSSTLVVPYVATSKNAPCRLFLEQRSHLQRGADDATFTWELVSAYQPPTHVTIQLRAVI
jgi:FkbH-like protein